jgi:hypothetical protein
LDSSKRDFPAFVGSRLLTLLREFAAGSGFAANVSQLPSIV